jgi:hypothetical protein
MKLLLSLILNAFSMFYSLLVYWLLQLSLLFRMMNKCLSSLLWVLIPILLNLLRRVMRPSSNSWFHIVKVYLLKSILLSAFLLLSLPLWLHVLKTLLSAYVIPFQKGLFKLNSLGLLTFVLLTIMYSKSWKVTLESTMNIQSCMVLLRTCMIVDYKCCV